MRLSFTFLKFGTDGYYAKCWKQDDSGVFLYKGGNTHCEIEPRFEYLVPQLSGYLCSGTVTNNMDFYYEKLVSGYLLFTDERMGLAKANAIFCGEKCTT